MRKSVEDLLQTNRSLSVPSSQSSRLRYRSNHDYMTTLVTNRSYGKQNVYVLKQVRSINDFQIVIPTQSLMVYLDKIICR